MSSADLATVVIACPNCGTRYQVPYGTLGKAGREVQCAQCGKPWHATADEPLPAEPPAVPATPVPAPPPPADPDAIFTAADEAALDSAFETEARQVAPHHPGGPLDPDHARTLAEIRAAIAPKPKPLGEPDPTAIKRAKTAFAKRQKQARIASPLARFRRVARIAAFVVLLALLAAGFVFRIDIVRTFPALAGLYAAIGLPVNVVGLEFTDTKTVSGLRDGKTVMQISAKIRSVTGAPVPVPPVLVSLVNDAGATLYEWTVPPAAGELGPGEILDFSTEVNAPPDGATHVRLSFTTRSGATAPTTAGTS